MKLRYFLILGVCCPFSVFADVSLYGRVAAALENDTFPSNNQVQPGTTSVQDYGSYFGIRGTDNVYGQTAAVWQVEQFLNITTGEAYQNTTGAGWGTKNPNSPNSGSATITSAKNTLASSDSYIGLQGGWGRIRIGNLSNTFRTNTGSIDIYNGANANVMGTYDRVLRVLPETVRYDSPTWAAVKFSAYYSANLDGNFNTGGANGNGVYAGDMNGFNNSPIVGAGIFYNPGYFSVTWNNQLWTNSGIYQTMGGSQPGYIGANQVSQGVNSYVSRLELMYNDPDDMFIGIGGQITQGIGWWSIPGQGNMNNFWIQNPSANGVNSNYINQASCSNGYCALNQAVLSTAEMGISFGWHIDNWTPKVGYVMGNNMMAGGSAWDIISGNNQIGGTGYQQVIAELDWNITPRTIAFVNYGQLWYGSAAQNTVMSSSGTTPGANAIAQGGSKWINNGTGAVGFSHTF